MSIEHQIQPIVAVAAFDPLLDELLVCQDESNSQFRLPTIEVQTHDGPLEDYLLAQFNKLLGTCSTNLVNAGSKIVRDTRNSAVNLFDQRVMACPEGIKGKRINYLDFDELDYQDHDRTFLHRLFEEFKRTGTLLSTLKQPVYIRPSFFDYEGERVLVPMEERKGGMPKNYLREEHLHLDEVIGAIVHEYLGDDRKQAKALRMKASSRQLVWKDKSTPIWQLDYGIEVSRMSADRMISGIKKRMHVIPANPTKEQTFPKSFNADAKRTLQEIHKLTREAILLATEFPTVRFEPKREAMPVVR